MISLRYFCLIGIMSLAFPMPVQAQETGSKYDILGSWSFRTKPYRNGQCMMTGTMRLTESGTPDVYACELTAMEMCAMWGRSVVLQSCQARRFGQQVSIRSEIKEMLESKTEGLFYEPDNFSLTIQNASRMWGALISASTAPVEFRRAQHGIS